MNFFKRLFKIGQAEANAALNKLENPIAMIEQGIADMRGDLSKYAEAKAQVKALAIKSKNEVEEHQKAADDYHEKAMQLLKKGQTDQLDETEAEQLAREALKLREGKIQRLELAKKDAQKFEDSVSQLDSNIAKIQEKIGEWDRELGTLKAKVKVSDATTNLNKQLAEIDGGDTLAMLNRMKDKVNYKEALSEAYADIAKNNNSIEQKIDQIIDKSSGKVDDALAELKNNLGISPKNE